MSNMTIISTFTAPLSPKARSRAEQLYRQQATPEKGEQVRLNTLAVSFVNFYLECMGFETDLEKSDRNPVQQTLMDIAILSLKNLGDIECRPVLANAQFVYVPPEVQLNRIGYVVVQIHESFREATILGFIKQVSTELMPLVQLQPLEDLLEYLEILAQANRRIELNTQPHVTPRNRVNLKQWFDRIFEVSWQEISTVLDLQITTPAWSARSTAPSRGKSIELGKHLTAQSVVLIVALHPENSQETDITVEVHPTKEQTYLPPNLQVSVLDFAGTAVMEAQARNTNKNIQLQFSAAEGEHFSVKLALGEAIAIEDFAI